MSRQKVTILLTEENCEVKKIENSLWRGSEEAGHLFDVLQATLYRTEGAIDKQSLEKSKTSPPPEGELYR